jgi:hypothetical protein
MLNRMAQLEQKLKGRPCPVCGEAKLGPAQPGNYTKVRCNHCGVRLVMGKR